MALDAPPPAANPNLTRDHLANERTFLAWVRTALGLIGLGFVLARMGLFLRQIAAFGDHKAAPQHAAGHEFMVTGVVFLLVGTALCGWSGWMYQRARRKIDAGAYEPAQREVFIVTVLVVLAGLVIAGLVVWRTLEMGL